MVLLVPPPISHEVDGLRRGVGDGSLERIAPHLTLVPPVNLRDEQAIEGLGLLRSVTQLRAPFELTIGPVATFAPVEPVLYLSVGDDSIDRVLSLRTEVFRPPFAREVEHPFVPHVTIGDSLAQDRIDASLTALAGYRRTVAVDRLHVLEERVEPERPRRWVPWFDVPFRPDAIIGRGGLEIALAVTDLVPPDAAAFVRAPDDGDRTPPEPEPEGARSLVVTARRDEHAVGLAAGWTLGESAHLDWVHVAEPVRGEGVARHLALAFESEAAARGCDRVSRG